ncbi:nucleotidyl transferase AbiEii/AbiGii toxin family protein [Candidatus Margulisiibacteriota bacterium]
MNNVVNSMLKKYSFSSTQEYDNALKEIIQEIALLGLWRAKFFEHTAFYGGSALRIFYELDRFSEDLDFSLIKPNPKFDLSVYHSAVKTELESFGFKVEINFKEKLQKSAVQSAFIKADTLESELNINIKNKKQLKIKFEIDTDPPPGFETEAKYLLQPIEFYVNTYTKESLFAGKLHALICRQWQQRIKGRDWYDLIWFIKNNIPANLKHLEMRMKQTNHLAQSNNLDINSLLNLLNNKINTLDIELAKKDILPFIKEPDRLDIWSKDFFLNLVSRIKII